MILVMLHLWLEVLTALLIDNCISAFKSLLQSFFLRGCLPLPLSHSHPMHAKVQLDPFKTIFLTRLRCL